MKCNIGIVLTKHAAQKIVQRKISRVDLRKVINEPVLTGIDRNDEELTHFIGCIHEKYLRVIVKWKKDNEVLVISAFYDRRIKGEDINHDKNKL